MPKGEIPLQPFLPQLLFEMWALDFVRSFSRRTKRMRAKYIIIVVEFLIKWVEAELGKDCIVEIAIGFIYQNIIRRFYCSLSIISD